MRRWWRSRSLRARLTLVASGAVAVGLLTGTVVLGAAFTRHEIGTLDAAARARAEIVRQLVASDRLPQVLPVDSGGGDIVEVVDARDTVLAASLSASRTLALLSADQLTSWPRGEPRSYSDDRLTGLRLRVVAVDATLNGRPVTVVSAVPLGDLLATLRVLRTGLLIVLPVLVLAVGLGSWSLAGSALRPVGGLRRAAERISDLGGGGVLPVPPGGDEVAMLAVTLNRMLDRLADAGARQRGFVADAAHELRSPLTSLRAGLEVAAVHPRQPAEAALADELLPEVVRLGRLVDDLLVLARLDEGIAGHRSTPNDLLVLTRDVARSLEPVGASAVGHSRLGGGGPAIVITGGGGAVADPEALRRILRNLLENAQRHARSRVEITVAPGRVTVADDGAGVPAGDRERIFARFTRLDDARTRASGGSGLGLAIARELARAAGGDLTVQSAPGGGAAFTVRLDPASSRPADMPSNMPVDSGKPGDP